MQLKSQQDIPAPISTLGKLRAHLPAIVFLLTASYLYFRSNVFKAPKQLNVAALDMKTLSGHPLSPASFQGKAVVLNFWAPWCGPCQLETPWLQKLQTAHPNDLVVIGIDDDSDTYAEAALFANSLKVTYPIVQKSGTMVSTIGAIQTLPTTLYITSSGAVVHTVIGAISEAHMEAYANDAIRH